VKAFPLKLQNKFEELDIDDSICYVKRFISKLKERISWLKPKHYFV